MKYIYTAIFEPTEDGSEYFARVPDLPGCITTGRDLNDAISQITDAASLFLVSAEDASEPIAPPTPQSAIERSGAEVCSLISVDTIEYRARTDNRAVRKNVSLPAWMLTAAEKRGINCSQLLQDALKAAL